MGDVTVLAERRSWRLRPSQRRGAHGSIAFYFDPCCPFSYLAAERIERHFAAVRWIPVAATALQGEQPWADPRVARLLRVLAERRASELGLPLVWPERFPPDGTAALRVAVHAARTGVGHAFALAASRLAFCGGFDLGDLENVVEAGAAAGIDHHDTVRAAADPGNDIPLADSAYDLVTAGVTQLPAFKVGPRWFDGEPSFAQASAWARAPIAVRALP
jgi:2-hydroxychromene-2-carboxylate isomerase